MDMVFNELSILPLAADKTESFNRVMGFIHTFKKANPQGFKRIRFEQYFGEIELSHNYTLQDFCNENRNRTLNSLLLGISRYPYIEDNPVLEESYIEKEYSINKNGIIEKCYGLAVAYLYSTSGIGFLSEPFWEQVKFSLIIDNPENGETSESDIFCLSRVEHADDSGFQFWVENQGEVTLVTTDLLPDRKEIKFKDDHGIDKLKAFAERLVSSPYVTKVINSIDFSPHTRDFIKKVYPDGKIELVLINTDAGYGMIVQTTGRNFRETAEIARLLKEKYN